jgi:uncharacterized tellurite resistance protein B-like protein
MEEIQSTTILTGYSDEEKAAYLGAIASLATADRLASQEELDHLENLTQHAGLSVQQRDAVLRAAKGLSGDELTGFLRVLRNSDLRFSLVTDLITFAEIDNDFSREEKENVKRIADHLGVSQTQLSLLDQYVQRVSQSNTTPEEMTRPGFLDSLGFTDLFSKAGINPGRSGRGVLGMLGPMLLGGMLGRGLRGAGLARGFGSNMNSRGFGGLGSIFSALNGTRGTFGMGGLLGRLLR